MTSYNGLPLGPKAAGYRLDVAPAGGLQQAGGLGAGVLVGSSGSRGAPHWAGNDVVVVVGAVAAAVP
ncbi:MAG TPA: hypothetical protein VMU76_13315 [Acidimicrobiales bacterium]|nr:hypothetical protein [Acidimicrobiales bacterium]